MTELPAEGVRGYLLVDIRTGWHFFRVYEEDHSYTDYELAIEDLQVTINSNKASLYREAGRNRVGWSTKYLSRGQEDCGGNEA